MLYVFGGAIVAIDIDLFARLPHAIAICINAVWL